MGPFDDSFGGFEEIFNRFAGMNNSRPRSNASTDLMETVVVDNGTYIVLDFSAREIKDVEVTDGLEEDEYGEEFHTGKKFLSITFEDDEVLKYVLPEKFKKNSFEWTKKHGILEVYFEK